MRALSLLCVVVLGCGPGPVAPRAAPAPPPGEGFVQVVDGALMLDGARFCFVGYNNYTLLTYGADPGLRAQVGEVMASADSLGMTVLRTWAFNDGGGWNALQTAPNVYDERVFASLDHVIATAAKHGQRLILPLVNNWDDYGGMAAYVAWSPTARAHDDFYTDPHCRATYKQYIADVLTRVNTITGIAYRDDPTILAWELANEPRCPSDPSGDTLVDWVEEMAAHVKSLDARHLLCIGSEGFYGRAERGKNPWAWAGAEGVDGARLHALEDVDIVTAHLYPHGATLGATVTWLETLAADVATLGKPLVLEEYGQMRPLRRRHAWFRAWLDAVHDDAAAGGAFAGSLVWIVYHARYEDYDGFGIYERDAATRALFEAEAARMAELAELSER